MRNTYEVRAQKFIQRIAMYIQGAKTIEDFDWAVCEYNRDHHTSVRMTHGMTRVVLITSDYVVKIDWSPESIEIFGGCEKEMALYSEAEADGFAYLFAKITPFRYKGMTFYIMPLIHGVGRTCLDAWDYMTVEENDWCYDHNLYDLHYLNYGWKKDHIVLIDYGAYDIQWAPARNKNLTIYPIDFFLILSIINSVRRDEGCREQGTRNSMSLPLGT